MKTLFSTAGVHPRDRYEYWHELLCNKLIPHDCTPRSRESFHGELKAGAVADIRIFIHETSPMHCRRTLRHVDHADNDELLVVRQGIGHHLVEQAGHEVLLKSGDITLVDPRQPMSSKHYGGSVPMVLKVPRRELEARVGRTQRMLGVSIKPSEPEHALTSAFLESLPAHADTLGRATADIVRGQALDLIAVSLAKVTDQGTPRVSSTRALVLVNVRAAIEARLIDPALDSEAVAAAAGVSVRYANAVLADVGTSIMHLVRTRRLERCRQALRDPSQTARTVSEIAHGWGFSDMTHFGRNFRKEFGLRPSEYRRLVKPA